MNYQWQITAKKKERYPITILHNSVEKICISTVQIVNADSVCVVYDKNVQMHAEKIIQQQNLPTVAIAVPGAEDSKSLRQYERIVETMLQKGVTARSVLIVVGGGVLCDLGGFIASTYKRGIRFILVPTTFNAMIDAAIGGKNALNIGMLKNCIGTIYHPCAVYIDTALLQKQPTQFIESGLVEVLKLAAMQSSELFGWIEEHSEEILEKNEDTLMQCIKHAIECKYTMHSAEEFTNPLLSSTYFGHSIGHAIEALSTFTISHTQAVSIGMITELHMSRSEYTQRFILLLKKLHQPIHIPIEIRTQALWDILRAPYPHKHTVTVCIPKPLGTPHCAECTFEDLVLSRDAE